MLLSPARRPSAGTLQGDPSGSRPHTVSSSRSLGTGVGAPDRGGESGNPVVVGSSIASSSSPIAGYMLSSKFYVEASRPDMVADSMSLVSPERWSHAHTSLHSSARPGEPSILSSSSQAAKRSFSSSYMKHYDYRRPNVSTTMTNRGTQHSAAVSAEQLPNRAGSSAAKIALTQQPYSTQRKAAECRMQLDLATGNRRSASSERSGILYDGLPYTWRQLVPFECPVRYPELMSYDPTNYHSIVARQTRDIGMRIVDFETARRSRAAEAIDLNMERGVVGASLRKHSMLHRVQSLNTYPGIVAPLA